jgi:hypothetical protein
MLILPINVEKINIINPLFMVDNIFYLMLLAINQM